MSVYHFLSALIGYCLAAVFSTSVSMTPALTLWGSLWTYFVLAFWWVVATLLAWTIPVALMMVSAFAAAAILSLAEWLSDLKDR